MPYMHDRISNLPDCVMSHILSRLPTKDAVRTSILSKDWKFKWTFIYRIEISGGGGKQVNEKFFNFVERLLLLTHNLQSFRLGYNDQYFLRHLKTWISVALSRNIHYLGIFFWPNDVDLPCALLNCRSLRELYLFFSPHSTLKVTAPICFPYLKDLHLGEFVILNDSSKSDVVKFNLPVLERLEMRCTKWRNVKYVEIYAPKMTRLGSLMYDDDVDEYSIKIIGNNSLVNFEFSSALARELSLSGLPVVSADLAYTSHKKDIHLLEKRGLEFQKLLKGIPNLAWLQLSVYVGKAITQLKPWFCLPRCYKMEMLYLEQMGDCNVEELFQLLHAAPYLKVLYIRLLDWSDYDYDMEEYIPSCIVSHLEEVRFRQFEGSVSELRFVKFLLKNASQLKKIRLYPLSFTFFTEEERNEIREELLTYSKSSSCIIWWSGTQIA